MVTRSIWRLVSILLLAALAAGCTLPFAASPTPFTFPTPNLTHTAIFSGRASATQVPPTLPPQATGEAPTATSPVLVTPAPSATGSTLSTRPNGTPVTAAYLTTAPTIDGDLSEWATTAYTANQIVFGGANWTGTTDLSATYYVGWDTGNLYLAVRVRDDRFVQISTGRYLYRGDDVEIQLDANLAGDYYTTYLDGDDYQLGLSPGNFGTLAPEVYLWYPAARESAQPTATVKARSITDGYELEARIPWSIFGITPAGDSRYGFALSCSDNDLSGTATQQSMVSMVGTRRLTNPTTWGTLILEAPGGS